MLCDLRADEVQEMSAAMSSTAAASGVVLFLLSLPVVQGLKDWSVTYSPTQICALKGSTVTIGCSFKYPSSENGRITTVNKKVWFTNGNDYDPDDLETDSAYAGRVTYSPYWWRCDLMIRDLRESDSAVYKFRFETNQESGSYTGLPGVTLTVTALQVHVDTSYYNRVNLTCQSSCQLHNHPSFIWYKNGQKIYGQTNMYLYLDHMNPSDSISCAVRGHETLPSPSVCVRGDSCNRVNYSNRSICALKGSSVDISCTYNSYDQQIQSKSWFYFKRGYTRASKDLSKVSQYEGRVEVTDTERGRSTLRIRDLRESDSAEYHFKFKTQSFEWTSSLPGTTLTVTDVQVQVTGQRLDCVTRCNPYGSSYVWYINGEQVDGASSPSYEISYEESSDYENSYSCALKGFEDFHSPLICHNIYSCNKVTYEKRSICALKGSSVDISCTYSNFEDRLKSTSWFRSGRGSEDLSKDSQFKDRVEVIGPMIGGSTLRIRDLRESDSAEYHFKFKTESFEWTSSLPGTTLTVAALQVKVSRIISVHQSRTELTCFSSCRPAAHHSFVWFKNNERMCEQSSYQDQFNPEDIISCAFKGHENDRSAPVYAPKLPSVSVSPSAEIVEGSSVTLTCSSDANPAAKYTWYKERKLMSRGQQYIFNSIQSSDSGEYYCTAENELGERSSECISINVKYIPKLVSTSPSVPPKPPSVSVSPSAEIVEGSLVTLTCSSDANPAAKYTWYKDQKLISTEPQFIFKFIQSSDSGEYYCTAENELGERSSESISINVKYIPKLLSASPSVPQKPPSVSVSPSGEIVEGSSVTLTCSSDANPTKYTWYKEGEDSPKASGQNFTITDIRPEHSGSYYCVAQNSKGRQNSASRPINIASSWKSAAFASITVVFLAFIILSGIILIRRKRCFKANSSIERPDNRAEGNANDYYTLSAWPEHHGPSAAAQSTAAEQQDDDCYTTVHFFRKQEEPNYYNIIPTQPKRQNEDEEVEDVEYTHIRFSSTQRLRHHQTVEDSAAVYGTVNRK